MDKNYLTTLFQQELALFQDARLRLVKDITPDKLFHFNRLYMLKAQKTFDIHDMLKVLVEDYLYWQEDALFTEAIKRIAISLAESTGTGQQSTMPGVDLEIEKNGRRYILSIQQDIDWWFLLDIDKIQQCLGNAQATASRKILPMIGFCYGKKLSAFQSAYRVISGKAFWKFISGDSDIYSEFVLPFKEQAKRTSELYDRAFSASLTLTIMFIAENFWKKRSKRKFPMNWERLVRFNASG